MLNLFGGGKEKAFERAFQRERERQRDITRRERQREADATRQGYGIMESSNVSLGSYSNIDEEEEETTGAVNLMI